MLLRVLGPVELDINGSVVPLGGPRQRAVLVYLLAARGEIATVDGLIYGLWRDDAPPSAVASLHAYISNLRRLLEPDRPRGARSRVLLTLAPGYALRLPAHAVDANRFEATLDEARELRSADPKRARLLLTDGLGLWRGPAFAEFAEHTWAQPEATRLEELRIAARELLIDVTLRAGAAAEAVAGAEVLTRQAPLREEGWRLLALALWASGRQADALAALRRARKTLVEESGLDPGPGIAELETAILTQRLNLPTPPAVARAGDPRSVEPTSCPPADQTTRNELFIGRQTELDVLRRCAAASRAGETKIALVTGEGGAGKTSLLEQLRTELTAQGWVVAVGRCPEVEDPPPSSAWVDALRQLAEAAPPGDLTPALAPLLGQPRNRPSGGDVAAGRFHLHRAVAAWLRTAAARQPVAVMLDDLHGADNETLLLLHSLLELTDIALLIIGTLRPTDNRERLADTMAALARRSPDRVHLDGLSPAEVAQLVGAVTGTRLVSETLDALMERTGGNPFYVRESARLLNTEGTLVDALQVPDGVRDVLRRRISRLPRTAVPVLRLAAVVGRETDLATLTEASGAEEYEVIEALEAGMAAGLLTEPAPGRVRFTHGVVRDTLYADISHLRRTGMHGRIAAAFRRLYPDDYSSLAHHYARAARAEAAPAAVDYAIRAARMAERRYAYDTAASLLTKAVEAADALPGDREAVKVDLLGRLLRAQARAGALAAAQQTRARAIDIGMTAGRDDLLVAAFRTWTVPTTWLTHPYGMLDRPVVDLLARLLRRDDLDLADRCRLLEALTTELDGEADSRGPRAGRQALAISRHLGDPELRALGLVARIRTLPYESAAPQRQGLAHDLTRLADEHEMVAFRWFAEQVIGQSGATMNDPRQVRDSVSRQGEMARIYHLNEAQVIHLGSLGLLAHLAGDFAAAHRYYDDAAARMRRQGSVHAEAFHYFATATLLINQGRLTEHLAASRRAREKLGPIVDDLLALALTASGRLDEAQKIPIGRYPCRPDYFRSTLLSVRGMAVVALQRQDLAQAVIDPLTPLRHQVAGICTTSLAVRPVAQTLGELHRLLGREAEARRCFALAATVARQWSVSHWLLEANNALKA